jgi:hypothetical protein
MLRWKSCQCQDDAMARHMTGRNWASTTAVSNTMRGKPCLDRRLTVERIPLIACQERHWPASHKFLRCGRCLQLQRGPTSCRAWISPLSHHSPDVPISKRPGQCLPNGGRVSIRGSALSVLSEPRCAALGCRCQTPVSMPLGSAG